MKRQSGFTLIELIMVIVILGILAATALPKFVNLGSDARAAAIKAVEGSMRAANSIIYAKASIGNAMGAAPASVSINGVIVNTNFGFAASLSPDLLNVMDINTTVTGDFAAPAGNVITHKGGATPANCSVTYTPATATATPIYATVTTGC